MKRNGIVNSGNNNKFFFLFKLMFYEGNRKAWKENKREKINKIKKVQKKFWVCQQKSEKKAKKKRKINEKKILLNYPVWGISPASDKTTSQ
jgi:hypothetical protein